MADKQISTDKIEKSKQVSNVFLDLYSDVADLKNRLIDVNGKQNTSSDRLTNLQENVSWVSNQLEKVISILKENENDKLEAGKYMDNNFNVLNQKVFEIKSSMEEQTKLMTDLLVDQKKVIVENQKIMSQYQENLDKSNVLVTKQIEMNQNLIKKLANVKETKAEYLKKQNQQLIDLLSRSHSFDSKTITKKE